MAEFPKEILPDKYIVTDFVPKYEGKDVSRQLVGTQFKILFTLDHCAMVPVTIRGFDVSTLPSPEFVNERNRKMDFLLAKFENLSITFSGGDFGSIRYKGTATGIEFLNLTPPATPPRTVPGK